MNKRSLSRALRITFMQLKRQTQKRYTAEKMPIQPRDAHFMEQLELKPGMSPQELAQFNDIDKAYITRRVRDLEKRGFLQRTPNQDDQRRIHLALTDEGRDIMGKGLTLMEDTEAAVFDCLEEDELATLYGLLQKVASQKCAEHRNYSDAVAEQYTGYRTATAD